MHLIETDAFPFEFLSQLAERESWRKEIHRPIYHVHKWWAKRLGSVFRGILLGAVLPETARPRQSVLQTHHFASLTVFDPFMGSGTTIGEAHKLGFTAHRPRHQSGRRAKPCARPSVRWIRATLESPSTSYPSGVGEENPRPLPIEGLAGPAV